jgi:hypothetical protein
MMPNSERDEPTEIETLDSIKIKQIFAKGYSSFAISDGGNNLYGWGNNSHGQLGINPQGNKNNLKIPIPTLIDLREKFNKELFVFQDRTGSRTFLAKCNFYMTIVNKPADLISQTMAYFINKNLHSKENLLTDEKKHFENIEEELKKRRAGPTSVSFVF